MSEFWQEKAEEYREAVRKQVAVKMAEQILREAGVDTSDALHLHQELNDARDMLRMLFTDLDLEDEWPGERLYLADVVSRLDKNLIRGVVLTDDEADLVKGALQAVVDDLGHEFYRTHSRAVDALQGRLENG